MQESLDGMKTDPELMLYDRYSMSVELDSSGNSRKQVRFDTHKHQKQLTHNR